MARLVLAHPVFLADNSDEQAASSPYFPLGLLYLAAWVRDHGHEVSIFDGTFAEGPEDFAAHLVAVEPDLVGISALVTSRDRAIDLARIAAANGTSVVMGGPDPTVDPGWYMAHPEVDLVVHHEGEQTIARLLDLVDEGLFDIEHLAVEDGIAFRVDNHLKVNRPRQPIEDLDSLPTPARDLIDTDRYLHMWRDDSGYTSMTVATSRGCPYGCEWCADAVHGEQFRQRSPESVAAEMTELKASLGVDSIRLVDDVDALDRSFFDQLADAVGPGANVTFEPLDRIVRDDLPLLEVRDSL